MKAAESTGTATSGHSRAGLSPAQPANKISGIAAENPPRSYRDPKRARACRRHKRVAAWLPVQSEPDHCHGWRGSIFPQFFFTL